MAQSITISNLDKTIEWTKMQILDSEKEIESAKNDILRLKDKLINLEAERTEILQKTTLR